MPTGHGAPLAIAAFISHLCAMSDRRERPLARSSMPALRRPPGPYIMLSGPAISRAVGVIFIRRIEADFAGRREQRVGQPRRYYTTSFQPPARTSYDASREGDDDDARRASSIFRRLAHGAASTR